MYCEVGGVKFDVQRAVPTLKRTSSIRTDDPEPPSPARPMVKGCELNRTEARVLVESSCVPLMNSRNDVPDLVSATWFHVDVLANPVVLCRLIVPEALALTIVI